MTSDISVTSTAYQVEKRGWLWGPLGTGPGDNPSVTLDITTFTAGTHYPNGYIPSGTALAKITASGLWGPYDSAASDGRQTPANGAGLLFSSVAAVQPNGGARAKVGGAIVVRGNVDPNRLPFQSGSGSAPAAVRTALPLIFWS
jgi:hypothetical protein